MLFVRAPSTEVIIVREILSGLLGGTMYSICLAGLFFNLSPTIDKLFGVAQARSQGTSNYVGVCPIMQPCANLFPDPTGPMGLAPNGGCNVVQGL